ncbi:MAG: ECF RNA polymerase sigma factor SigR [Candidatus Xenobia bacterium]
MSETLTAADRFERLLIPVLTNAYATARHLARCPDRAENLVQEASLRAFRSFHTFQEGTNFRAWFLRILTNLYLEEYRQQKRRPELVSVEEAGDLYLYSKARESGLFQQPGKDPAREVLARLSHEQVHLALGELAEEFRLVCTLYFLNEMSYQEIADAVGVPVGTVRSRLHRGRKQLQQRLGEFSDDRSGRFA